MSFSKDVLRIDAAKEFSRIEPLLKEQVFRKLKKKGVVVGLSGGIDSSATVALCARVLGPERVLALLMPEKESADESTPLGKTLAGKFGVACVEENIAPLLEAAGCYRRRDEAIRKQVPEYGPGYRCKIVLSDASESRGFDFFYLVMEEPDGKQQKIRLSAEAYLGILAATNMKQRARKFYEYYHADRLNFAVAGTPNRLEYDQGFFVKNGDGAADLKPIAHLYKSQVYQMAEFLGVPEEIRRRPPTTDTYSLPQSQEEFYFALPCEQMDLCVYGLNHGVAAEEVARAAGLTTAAVESVCKQIESKRQATRWLHTKPLLMEEIPGIG